jgi:hypothetical protein
MKRRFQVWAPFFWVSPQCQEFARDLQRAALEWNGEDRIWLLPEAKSVQRWRHRLSNFVFDECWVPSELLNLVLVFNVDELGRMYPRLALPESWRGRLPEELYSKWLNTQPVLTRDDPPELVKSFETPSNIIY